MKFHKIAGNFTQNLNNVITGLCLPGLAKSVPT